MTIARILPMSMVWALLVGGQPVLAEGIALANLIPCVNKEPTRTPARKAESEPSALERLNADTKKFFNSAASALTLKKAPPKRTATQYTPWLKGPKEPPAKKSWLTSMFRRDEPRVKTMKDWVGLERPY